MSKQYGVRIGLGFLLVVIVLLIYGRTAGFGFVPYDDPAIVTGNGYVNQGVTKEGVLWALAYVDGGRTMEHAGVANLWHPATWISHMIDVEIFGLKGGGHHVTNVLLHILNGLLVFVLFSRVLKNWVLGFFVALLFVVHPLRVESVAWVSERKDVLSGFFFWAAILTVFESWERTSLRTKKGLHALGLVCFGLALLSKPSVVVLPVLLIALEGWRRGEQGWGVGFWIAAAKRWWMWFALSAVASVLTMAFQHGGSHAYFIEQSSLGGRLISTAAGIWFYLWRVIWPFDLSVKYPFPEGGLVLYGLAWVALLGALGLLWRLRNRITEVVLGVFWFLVCLLPVSGIVYVGAGFTADRYLYLALAGPLFALVYLLGKSRVGMVVLAVLAVFWTGLSWRQVGVWENGWTLFEHATKAQPRSTLGWTNLGGMYQEEGDLKRAEESYQEAVKISPQDYVSHYNLGNVLSKAGDRLGAEKSYGESLRWYPNYLPAMKNLGLLVRNQGQQEEAAQLFRKGSELTQNRDEVFLWLLCETELARGNKDAAKDAWNRLLTLGVKNPAVKDGMSRARPFFD